MREGRVSERFVTLMPVSLGPFHTDWDPLKSAGDLSADPLLIRAEPLMSALLMLNGWLGVNRLHWPFTTECPLIHLDGGAWILF